MHKDHEQPTRKIRQHHQEILGKLVQLQETIDRLEKGETVGLADQLKEASKFLDNELRPHAQWEEDNLYPAVGELVRRYGKPTATMEVDHQAIVERIDRFRNDVAAFLSLGGRPQTRGELVRQLIKNAWQLDAVLSLHLQKEEDVYLSLADSHWTEKDVEKLLGGEH